ncbi:hypothetical protein BCR34DRAFT_344769 [Clohesyomyces aquaticus]|uniref:Zn(2)-C6 fungal-type domain-containing protein n=1 Tax=Clohesyomyces aquaticus TaxID=1231657 RepID=A0A1Y1ZK81_9PLEO|nr:hypothetical protein BCR34DRAFT_344769 [Clohesyomyces aquaticus]
MNPLTHPPPSSPRQPLRTARPGTSRKRGSSFLSSLPTPLVSLLPTSTIKQPSNMSNNQRANQTAAPQDTEERDENSEGSEGCAAPPSHPQAPHQQQASFPAPYYLPDWRAGHPPILWQGPILPLPPPPPMAYPPPSSLVPPQNAPPPVGWPAPTHATIHTTTYQYLTQNRNVDATVLEYPATPYQQQPLRRPQPQQQQQAPPRPQPQRTQPAITRNASSDMACLSCRQSKQRCDKALPACQRCVNGNRDCDYPTARKKPSRSKACRHCQTRKRKCDLVTPSCGYCVSQGVQCEYPLRGG